MKTQLAEGQRIQYNFVKPHVALDGQTPAQPAGVGLGSKNKWMGLLEQALVKKPTFNSWHWQDSEPISKSLPAYVSLGLEFHSSSRSQAK